MNKAELSRGCLCCADRRERTKIPTFLSRRFGIEEQDIDLLPVHPVLHVKTNIYNSAGLLSVSHVDSAIDNYAFRGNWTLPISGQRGRGTRSNYYSTSIFNCLYGSLNLPLT